MLSTQRRPFSWNDALEKAKVCGRGVWASQLEFLKGLRLPAPRLVPSQALEKFARAISSASDEAGRIAARKALRDSTILGDKAPVNADGRLACKLLAVSFERDSCQPDAGPKDKELRLLGDSCASLRQR